MKTPKEIAADCGLNEGSLFVLERHLYEEQNNAHDWILTPIIRALYRRIEALEPCLENCVIMQSRVKAILAVDEAVDALCAEDVFGSNYGELLAADELALREAIKGAGGKLEEGSGL